MLPARLAIALALVSFVAAPVLGSTDEGKDADAALSQRIARILEATPLIDGHNDLPWEIRDYWGNVDDFDMAASTLDLHLPSAGGERTISLMTDLPRLRAGRVGGVFWSTWIPPELSGPEAVATTLEQIDIVRSLVEKYPRDLELALRAEDIERIHREGRIASLIGIEGGAQIGNSMAVLLQVHALVVRYVTLTHSRNTDWADAATDNPLHGGLTPFGREMVREMNRLGMLVDLAHVAASTMRDAIRSSRAPVMFSHSGAQALVDHPRNVPDDVLRMVADNRGIVMVNFYPDYISTANLRWAADRAAEAARFNSPPFDGLYIGQPERAAAAMAQWERANPRPEASIGMVADHIEHIRAIAGIGSVGLGSDFDGIGFTPVGLEGVDRFPALFEELARRGWSDDELADLAGRNLLRVMREAEAVAARLQRTQTPSHATLAMDRE